MLAYLANQKGEEHTGNGSEPIMSSLVEKADLINSTNNFNLVGAFNAAPTVVDSVNNTVQSLAVSDTGALVNGAVAIDVSSETEMDTEQLVTILLEIVADRTGYPVDMIDPTLDLEADLGIDSIKRVEILNKFRRVLPDAKQKQLESGIEELAGARTLQGIIDWLRASNDHVTGPGQQTTENNGSHKIETAALQISSESKSHGNGKHDKLSANTEGVNGDQNGHHNVIKRGLVAPINLPELALTDAQVAERLDVLKDSGSLVLIVGDKLGLSDNLGQLLSGKGFIPVILKGPGNKEKKESDSDKASVKSTSVIQQEIDLYDFEQVKTCLDNLQQKYGAASTVFYLQSFAENDAKSNRIGAISLLHLLKYFSLNAKGTRKIAFISATSMGGKFGHDLQNTDHFFPTQAAIPGVIKVAAKEMPAYPFKAVDFDLSKFKTQKDFSSENLKEITSQLIRETVADDNIIEVGYRAGKDLD